jgi:hypothetical protein
VIEDDAGTPEQGLNVFRKLINQDRVAAIIGPTLSNVAQSADPEAQRAKVPVLGVSNTAPTGITDIGEYIFRDSLTEAQVIPQTIKAAKAKLGLKKVAILYSDNDAFTKGGYEVFKSALEAEGIQIATTQTFATKDTDFNAQLTAAKQAGPDALVFSALAAEASSASRGRSSAATASTRRPSSRTPARTPRASSSAPPGTRPAPTPRASSSSRTTRRGSTATPISSPPRPTPASTSWPRRSSWPRAASARISARRSPASRGWTPCSAASPSPPGATPSTRP